MTVRGWLRTELAANPTGFWLAALFLVLVLPSALMIGALMPPGQAPDETVHAMRISSLAGGELVGHRVTQTGPGGAYQASGVDADAAMALVTGMFRDTPITRKEVLADPARAAAIPWSGARLYFQLGAIASYFPIFYAPAALVQDAVWVVGGSPYDAFRAERLINALLYGLLGAAALLCARRGHGLIFAALALPMSVSLGGSLNNDGGLIVTATLAAALLTRQGSLAAIGLGPSLPAAALCLLFVALAKPPFAPLAGLLLLPLAPPWRRAAMRLGLAVLVLLLVSAWSGYIASHVVGVVSRPPAPAGPLWPGAPGAVFAGTDPAAQLTVFTSHPLRLLTMSWQAIVGHPVLAMGMIGVLGWLDVFVPPFLYTLWYVALAAAVLAEVAGPRDDAGRWRWPDAIWVILVLVAAMIGLTSSVYLTWIDVGQADNDGMQGRYLTPLVPMLALLLPRLGLPYGRGIRIVCLAVPVAVAAIGLIVLPTLMVGTYYLR